MKIEYELKFEDLVLFLKELKSAGFCFKEKLKLMPKTVAERIFLLIFYTLCSIVLVIDIIVASRFSITLKASIMLIFACGYYYTLKFAPMRLFEKVENQICSVHLNEENINITNGCEIKSFYYTQVIDTIETNNFLSIIFEDDKLEKFLFIPKKVLNDKDSNEFNRILQTYLKNKKLTTRKIKKTNKLFTLILFFLATLTITLNTVVYKFASEFPSVNLTIGNKNIEINKKDNWNSDTKLQEVYSLLQNENLNFAGEDVNFILQFNNVKEKYGKNHDSISVIRWGKHFIYIDNKYKNASINALVSQIAARSIGLDTDVSLNERIYAWLVEAYVWKYLNQNDKNNITDNKYITNIEKYMGVKDNFWDTLEEREKFLNALVITSPVDGKNLIEYVSLRPELSKLKKESRNFKNKEFKEKFNKLLNLYNSIE